MKLLCVIDNLGTGGAQRQILNLAIGLHRAGHDVSMYCYAPGALLAPYLEKEGLGVHVQLKKSRFSLDVIGGLRRFIDEGRFEALDVLRREHGLRPRVSWVGQRMRSGDRGAYLRTMEEEIQRTGISGQWEWLDQRTDIPDLFRQHDVLVHPSYGEGLPNVVCEAMACGRPVILSNVLDHPRLVADGVNGYLFDRHDPAELARKIKQFIALPPDERHRMGQNG